MEAGAILRMLGSLGLVLGLLGGALWAVRRFDLRLPGHASGARGTIGRVQLVEKIALDTRRAVILIRRDSVEHLLLVGPEGTVVVEGPVRCTAADRKWQAERRSAIEADRRANAQAVEQTREKLRLMVSTAIDRLRHNRFKAMVEKAMVKQAMARRTALDSPPNSPALTPVFVGQSHRKVLKTRATVGQRRKRPA